MIKKEKIVELYKDSDKTSESFYESVRPFITEFPISRLKDLKIEEYSGDKGKSGSLINTITHGKLEKAGFSLTFYKWQSGISNKDGKYYIGTTGKNIKPVDDIDKTWNEIKDNLYSFFSYIENSENLTAEEFDSFANEERFKGDYFPRSNVVSKLCVLYFPDRFLAINKDEYINNLAKVMGYVPFKNPVSRIYQANIELRKLLVNNSVVLDKDTFQKLEDIVWNNFASQNIYDLDTNYWFIVANPDVDDGGWRFSDTAIGGTIDFHKENHKVKEYFKIIKPGEKIIGYQTSPFKKVIALLTVIDNCDDYIRIKKDSVVDGPTYEDIKNDPIISNIEPFKNGAKGQGTLFHLSKDEYDEFIKLCNLKENSGDALMDTKKDYPKYTDEDFIKEVFLSKDNLNVLKNLLKEKKNIILCGAPGTGKTFAAKRLAYCYIGSKDTSKIKFVQFHQNYTYEDFVMGYKPNGEGFELQDGIFYKFCNEARNDINNDYFFIIDEINRGNLSKIFGELLMLIEKDHRDEEIVLSYKHGNIDEKFSVPHNVYIIGMMNTADRSIALIDYALRRRFSFYTMKPAFDSSQFKAYMNEITNPGIKTCFGNLVEQIKSINEKIDEDSNLSEGFEIGHSYFVNSDKDVLTPNNITIDWLKDIVEYEIKPLLEEYFFDDKGKFDEYTHNLDKVFKTE